jgi:hypothetical protein
MSGVSAGEGISVSSPQPSELELIYQGGENFLARMKALSDQRAAHEKALRELNLGSDAKAAYDEAQKLKGDAQADRESAKNELLEAKKQAAALLDDARAHADDLKNKALISARSAEEKANQVKADAESYADAKKGEADDLVNKASSTHRQAKEKLSAVEAMQAEHLRAKSDYEAALAQVQKTQRDFEERADKVRKALDFS